MDRMKPYRKEKIESSIREIVSELLLRELQDPRVSSMTTVSRVEVTGDLSLAKVYISVLGTPTEERMSLAGLQHALPHFQRIVARELSIRQCPKLSFHVDKGMRNARETLRLIADNRRDLEARGVPVGEGDSANVREPGDKFDEEHEAEGMESDGAESPDEAMDGAADATGEAGTVRSEDEDE